MTVAASVAVGSYGLRVPCPWPNHLRDETAAPRYDSRHSAARRTILERLIARTALGCHLRSHRSAQRFERDTYHGDALPTELRGRVLSCLTWAFAPRGDQLRWCTPVTQRNPGPRPETKLPPGALESLPHSRRRSVFTWRRPAPPTTRPAGPFSPTQGTRAVPSLPGDRPRTAARPCHPTPTQRKRISVDVAHIEGEHAQYQQSRLINTR